MRLYLSGQVHATVNDDYATFVLFWLCAMMLYVSVSSPKVYACFFLFTKTKDHFNFVPVRISRFLEAIRTDAIFTFNERANFTHQYIFKQFLNEKKNTNFTVEISSAKQTNEMPTTIKKTILNLSIQYAASGFCRHWMCLYTYIENCNCI